MKKKILAIILGALLVIPNTPIKTLAFSEDLETVSGLDNLDNSILEGDVATPSEADSKKKAAENCTNEDVDKAVCAKILEYRETLKQINEEFKKVDSNMYSDTDEEFKEEYLKAYGIEKIEDYDDTVYSITKPLMVKNSYIELFLFKNGFRTITEQYKEVYNKYIGQVDSILQYYVDNVKFEDVDKYPNIFKLEDSIYLPYTNEYKFLLDLDKVMLTQKERGAGYSPTKDELSASIDKEKLAKELTEDYTEVFKMFMKKYIYTGGPGLGSGYLPGNLMGSEGDVRHIEDAYGNEIHFYYDSPAKIKELDIQQEDLDKIRKSHEEYLSKSKEFLKKLQVLNVIVEDEKELLDYHKKIFNVFTEYKQSVKEDNYKNFIDNLINEPLVWNKSGEDWSFGDEELIWHPYGVFQPNQLEAFISVSPHYHPSIILGRKYTADDVDYRLTKEWLQENGYIDKTTDKDTYEPTVSGPIIKSEGEEITEEDIKKNVNIPIDSNGTISSISIDKDKSTVVITYPDKSSDTIYVGIEYKKIDKSTPSEIEKVNSNNTTVSTPKNSNVSTVLVNQPSTNKPLKAEEKKEVSPTSEIKKENKDLKTMPKTNVNNDFKITLILSSLLTSLLFLKLYMFNKKESE